MHNSITKRQIKEKEILLDQLKKTPIVQIACEKSGIGRATYYRWRKGDPEFTLLTDNALEEGNLFVNDMAESQLMSAIKDKNLGAIIFWLKHHHPSYTTKVEVTARLKQDDEKLTNDQEALVIRALKLASMLPTTVPEISKEGE
ncbi:MAG: phBC6A51 family helix-turn-helix protein [Nanoarchaeota archaeon]